jgi:hypothetical protein
MDVGKAVVALFIADDNRRQIGDRPVSVSAFREIWIFLTCLGRKMHFLFATFCV